MRETHLQECRYTVCKPVQTTTYKTVSKTCYQTVSETAYRETCETVCVPRTVTKPVCQHHQRSGRPALLRARQDGLHQRLPGSVPRHVVRKDGLLPAHGDRKRLLHGLRIATGSSSRYP